MIKVAILVAVGMIMIAWGLLFAVVAGYWAAKNDKRFSGQMGAVSLGVAAIGVTLIITSAIN